MKTFYLFLIAILVLSCSKEGKLIPIPEEEILTLTKNGTLNDRVYKYLDENYNEISKEEAIKFTPDKYFGQRFKDTKNDSTVILIRKITEEDKVFAQKFQFAVIYKNYTDTITSYLKIDCSKTDSLLHDAAIKDQENRVNSIDSKIDALNQRTVFNIIEQCGFPTNPKGAEDAWLIIQHSDISFQKKYYPLLQKSVNDKILHPQCLALTEDRINVSEGKPQLYGTQYHEDKDGTVKLSPIDDFDKVNERRAKLKLEPISRNEL